MANRRSSQPSTIPVIEQTPLLFLFINDIFHNGSKMTPFQMEIFMPSLTIKKIPKRLFQAVRQSAKAHHRSINREVINGLEKTFTETPVDPVAFLSSVDQMREQLGTQKLTERILRKAREQGRP
jgi:antitoxin FitA